jgi:hypothetical protein
MSTPGCSLQDRAILYAFARSAFARSLDRPAAQFDQMLRQREAKPEISVPCELDESF